MCKITTTSGRGRDALAAGFGRALSALLVLAQLTRCSAQIQGGVYDFGQNTYGQKRGSWTPGEWLVAVLMLMTIVLGLALSLGLCYYVNRRQAERRSAEMARARRDMRRQLAGLQVEDGKKFRSYQQEPTGRTSEASLVVQI